MSEGESGGETCVRVEIHVFFVGECSTTIRADSIHHAVHALHSIAIDLGPAFFQPDDAT